MNRRTWQIEETEVTRLLSGDPGANRRGPNGANLDDCAIPGVSVEVKLHGALGFSAILAACKQAEAAAAPGELPLAVVRTKGASKKDRLVVFRLPVFLERYGTFGGSS